MTESTATETRFAAYAQDGIMDPDKPHLHMVAYVYEGQPGYFATKYTGDLDYCTLVAESINQTLGHTPEDVRTIVASSFAAQNRRDGNQ